MENVNFFLFPWSHETASFVSTYLVIPAGIIILYFWGKYHFNSPSYKLELEIIAGRPGTDRVKLLTQAPPRFTTTKSHFNSYALRYVLLLEAIYLLSVFAYPVVKDIITATKLKAPDLGDETLQYRAIATLVLLTGFLPSFPGAKQLDSVVLAWLHKAALIPDSVRDLATKLCESELKPSTKTIAEVRNLIISRDVRRVADGETSGTLEKRIHDLLCLRTQIATNFKANRYNVFRIKLVQDLQALTAQTNQLREEAIKYLSDQERFIPENVTDIDVYIANNQESIAAIDLAKRRNELQGKCEVLYESECLLIALALFATTSSPEEMSETIRQLGLDPGPDILPVWDWDTIVLVTLSVFMSMLAFNVVYTVVGYASGLFVLHPELWPEKSVIVRLLFLLSTAYATVLWLVLRQKRKWRRKSSPISGKFDNRVPIVSLYASS